jgi:curved DNA-binding protein CbpA
VTERPAFNQPPPEDPVAVLEIAPNADAEALRAAYLAKVKQFPPERFPAEFERIRDAYAYLRDPKHRARQMFLAANPLAPFVSLLDSARKERRYVGSEPWLAVLKEKRP